MLAGEPETMLQIWTADVTLTKLLSRSSSGLQPVASLMSQST